MRPNRKAYLLADVMIGLAIVASLTAALAVTVGAQRRSLQKLADSRHATRVAENVLTDLQSRRQPQINEENVTLQIRTLSETPPVAGWHWVQVQVSVRSCTVSLAGLVPQSNLAKEKP